MGRTRFLAVVGAIAMAAFPAGPAKAGDAQPTAPKIALAVTAPPGFEDLTGPQQVVLDVYMGGVRVGEAIAIVEPGHFRFADARKLVDSLPGVGDRPKVLAELAAPDLDPHTEAVCPPGSTSCPRPKPDVAAIIFDAARYRVEILVDPRFLTVKAAVRMQNLPPPSDTPALVNFLSGTVSGGGREPLQYYLQDNAVLGIGTGRLRANFQQASYSGFHTDTFAAEIDRPGMRYTAGAFWIPGNTLLDRVKMVGLGLSTQFNTRLDRDQLMGSPLILFLEQRARVDILVDGRIMSSMVYDAGNQALDTSGLPEGSYTVTLRTTSASGGVRQEQRFFSRSSTLPMMGHDAFLLYAGAVVRNSDGVIGDLSRTPLFQGGWARRMHPNLSVNLGVIGTDRRQWASVGATLLNSEWQLDTSVMVSNRGGLGLFGHLTRTTSGRLSIDLDARRVSNPGGGPLLATTTVFLPTPGGLEYTLYSGAYTQFSGAVGYRIGQGRLGLAGTYRRQANGRDYSLGPALYLPLVRGGRVALDFNGSYTATRAGRQAYAGLNLSITRPRTTYTVTGASRYSPGDKALGEVEGGLHVARRFDNVLGAQVQADGGVAHANGTSYAEAQVQARSAVGGGNLNLVQPFGRGGPQFGASLHTAMVVGQGGVRFNDGTNGDAMVVIHIDADDPGATFEVLVDNRMMGTARVGKDLVLTLPSYRAYAVRIRARGQVLSDYDGNARQVSLYPGNVVWFDWRSREVAAVFGRLVRADGEPIVHAEIAAGGDLAQSDEKGNFMIQTSPGGTLDVRTRDGRVCKLALRAIKPVGGYAMIGDQLCQSGAGEPDEPAHTPQFQQPKDNP
jgi:outer membrane usher protein FimD/PapC